MSVYAQSDVSDGGFPHFQNFSTNLEERFREERRKRQELVNWAEEGEAKLHEALAELARERGLRAQFNQEIAQREQELQDISQKVRSLQAAADDKDQCIREKDERIRALESQLHATEDTASARIRELECRFSSKEDEAVEMRAMRMTVSAREHCIKELQGRLEVLEFQAAQTWNDCEDLHSHCEDLNSDLYASSAEVATYERRLESTEAIASHLGKELVVQQQGWQVVQTQLSEYRQQATAELRDQQQHARLELAEQRQRNGTELAEQKHRLEFAEARAEKFGRALTTGEADVEKLRADVSYKERKVQKLHSLIQELKARESSIRETLVASAPCLTAAESAAQAKANLAEETTHKWREECKALEDESKAFCKKTNAERIETTAELGTAEANARQMSGWLRACESALCETAHATARHGVEQSTKLEMELAALEDQIVQLKDENKQCFWSSRSSQAEHTLCVSELKSERDAYDKEREAHERAVKQLERRAADFNNLRTELQLAQSGKDQLESELEMAGGGVDAVAILQEAAALAEDLRAERTRAIKLSASLTDAQSTLEMRDKELDRLRMQFAKTTLSQQPRALVQRAEEFEVDSPASQIGRPAKQTLQMISSLSMPVLASPHRATVGTSNHERLLRGSPSRRGVGIRHKIEQEAAAYLAAGEAVDAARVETSGRAKMIADTRGRFC